MQCCEQAMCLLAAPLCLKHMMWHVLSQGHYLCWQSTIVAPMQDSVIVLYCNIHVLHSRLVAANISTLLHGKGSVWYNARCRMNSEIDIGEVLNLVAQVDLHDNSLHAMCNFERGLLRFPSPLCASLEAFVLSAIDRSCWQYFVLTHSYKLL